MQPRKTLQRIALTLTALFTVASLTAACGTVGGEEGNGGAGTGAEEGKEITIGWIPWDEDIAATYLWKYALEKKGYTVNLEQLDVAPIFQALDRGQIDVFLDGWLPVTHESYWAKYGDGLEKVGTWYSGTTSLTVPAYVKDVNTIEDLGTHADEFNGEIVGIEGGAGIMAAAEKTIKAYGLEADGFAPTAKVSSTSAMIAELEKAYKAKEPIVVTLWRPHWVYSKLDLKDLEDPEGTMGTGDDLTVIGKSGFKEEFPEVAGWMKNFEMEEADLLELENLIREKYADNPEGAVEEWAKDHQSYVDGLTK